MEGLGEVSVAAQVGQADRSHDACGDSGVDRLRGRGDEGGDAPRETDPGHTCPQPHPAAEELLVHFGRGVQGWKYGRRRPARELRRPLADGDHGRCHVRVRTRFAFVAWHQKAVLAAPPGGDAANGFGQAVAVSAKGDEIAVGAPGTSVGGHPNSGAVYLFTRRPGGWSSNTSAASMTSSDPSDGKGIGGAVAVSGSVVVAGNGHSQSVYVFMREAGGWASETQTAELSRPQPPRDARATRSTPSERPSRSTGKPGQWDTTYPSARTCNVSGAVFIFQRPSSGWANTSTATATLEAKDGGLQNFVGQSIACRAARSSPVLQTRWSTASRMWARRTFSSGRQAAG